MTFLQPLLLMALPLMALPLLIHLVNRQRYRTVYWGATMFLLQARRMASGMARLRYLLILLARMLVIGGLILAISRPMSGGWLGFTAGDTAETTLIILDRSASMEEQDPLTGRSRRETALQKLSTLLTTAGANSQLVLFSSATERPLPLESAGDLQDLPETDATASAADLPALLQSAAEYIATNQTGRTDVWVCSDLREQDWNPEGGRWDAVRSQLQNREGVRFYLLSYTDSAADNLAVSVSNVHRRSTPAGAELVLDLKITRATETTEPQRIPLSLIIDGARSVLDVELTGTQLLKNGHVIPLDQSAVRGWGRVELPGDANPADNVFTFVYAEPAVQRTVIVADDNTAAEYLRIAAGTSAGRGIACEASILPVTQAVALPWQETSLIIWQAPLPTGLLAAQLTDFAASGRSLLFLPPTAPDAGSLFGWSWADWELLPADKPARIARWRTDADLLANTQTGAPLPVGQLEIRQVCPLAPAAAAANTAAAAEPATAAAAVADEPTASRLTVLAQLDNGQGLLHRVQSDRGSIYFCCTLPTAAHSSLVSNGVVFYVLLQRTLAQGAAALSAARQLSCSSELTAQAAAWSPLDDLSQSTLLSRRSLTPGVYTEGDALLAVNRPLTEDAPDTLSDAQLQTVFGELNYTRIEDRSGSTADLASEVWRLFLILMIVALLAEAILCVPQPASQKVAPS